MVFHYDDFFLLKIQWVLKKCGLTKLKLRPSKKIRKKKNRDFFWIIFWIFSEFFSGFFSGFFSRFFYVIKMGKNPFFWDVFSIFTA